MASEPGMTRYARIVSILDAAASGSTSDYGGQGRFWAQGVDRLKTAVVSGVRMIAPETPAPCCEPDASGRYCRGAASALVRGLRGEAPFDGRRLPRLPWGGQPVDPADIAFIADWIDDGLPENDRLDTIELGPLVGEASRRIAVSSVQEFAVRPDARPNPRPGEPRQRQNLDCMTEPEIDRLRRAFRTILDLDQWPEDRRSFNNQALIHQNHCQHGWERFLPWHRAYLYEFEQNLQDFEPGVTLPYWDWTMPHYQPEHPTTGWIIPRSFKAFLTREATDRMLARLDPSPTLDQRSAFQSLAENRVLFTRQSEFFAEVYTTIGYTHITPLPGDANRQAMIDALLESNPLWYPLRYPAQYTKKTIEKQVQYHYPTADDIRQIMSLDNFRDFGGGSIYDAAFGFIDQNPHNTLHIWTGGINPDYEQSSYGPRLLRASDQQAVSAERRNLAVRAGGRLFHSRSDLYSQPHYGDMYSNLTASYDQVFWPIHANVDRLWADWQKRNPNADPVDKDSILSPWNYTVGDTLDITQFGYEYIRGSHYMPVGLDAPVGRFVSAEIHVTDRTRPFKRAELRLHWVPQLLRSCFVRVFLNLPGADAETVMSGNPHYAGYLAIFGHGACYGGPGHCDVPPPVSRLYDKRTRNHNTPRNHRIDITEAARRQLTGADSLRITLVVIGADYEEDVDVLRLEGVSLNFLD
jgi:tyrosinase